MIPKYLVKSILPGDGSKVEKVLHKVVEWSVEWQMQFNVKQCKEMHIGKKNIGYEYSMNGAVVDVVETEKDLGVMISYDPTSA